MLDVHHHKETMLAALAKLVKNKLKGGGGILHNKSKLLSLAVARTFVACGVFPLIEFAPAMARQLPEDGQMLSPVVVTGSYLPRTDTETPSSVQIITAEDLRKSGYTTVAEVLQHITANGQGTLSQGFAAAFAAGATGISLRGLKTSATLVLIDGHRMAPYSLYDDGHTAFVDVSMLPFDAVERIEILKDGASAVYGSDAIAGVVNIILRKHFDGTRLSADAGSTTQGGGTTTHASVIRGFGDYYSDGYNGYVNLEFRRQGDITYAQRAGTGEWQNLDWTALGGVNKTLGMITPQNPTPATLSPYLTNPNVPFSGAPNSSYFYPGACGSYAKLAAGGCAYQNPHAELQPAMKNVNLLASVTKQLADGWKLDLKASLFARQTEQYPTLPNTGGLLAYPSSFTPLIGTNGPAPTLVGTTIPAITVPANYPGNPFGVPAVVHGIVPRAPIANTQLDSLATRIAVDLSGKAGQWDIDTSVGHSRITTKQAMYGNVSATALNAALNRPVNPLKINGPISVEDMATIFPTAVADVSSELDFVEFHLSRAIAPLPGGDLKLGIGASYTTNTLDAPAPYLVGAGLVSSNDNGNFTFAYGSQTTSALYAELVAPVLKTLELDGSLRYDHVSGYDNLTPKFGFKWAPNTKFALRGTLGREFRAPNQTETNNSGQVYQTLTINDPVLCPGGIPANGKIAQGSVVNACSTQPLVLVQGSPKLVPEKSTAATLGVILEPVKGWSTMFDFYRINVDKQVFPGAPSDTPVRGSPVQTLCADGNGGTITCPPAVGPIVYYPSQFINANSVRTSGVDIDTRYTFRLGAYGSLTTGLQWSHMFSYVLTVDGVPYQLAGTHGPFIIGADTGNPKDKIQLTLGWEKGAWTVTSIFNWMSGFDLTDPSYGLTDCATGASANGWFPGNPPPSRYCRVKPFLETDLSVRYKVSKNLTLHSSVINLFNQSPPVDLNSWSGGQLPFNPSMHLPGAIGRFIAVGATYNF